jgi:hydroxymethylpyrimidine/phosphomethylpyrimidine kinase
MERPSYVLTISGSDSSGGAGMQADNRAILAAGAFPLNVITAVTLQTPSGVAGIELMSPACVAGQIKALLLAYPVAAIKSGMLGNAAMVEAVASVLADFPQIPYVLDPVICASSGDVLLDAAGVEILCARLMLRAVVTTPNLNELAVLLGGAEASLVGAAALAAQVGQALLVKGGHAAGAVCEDWLIGADGRRQCYAAARVDTRNVRGTGCVLSSFIAARIAQGDSLEDAVQWAKQQMTVSLQAQRGACWVGAGPSLIQESESRKKM